MTKKKGVEAKTAAGLTKVRPVWEHEVDKVREIMRKHGQGYTFAIVQHPAGRGRLYYLYTNMKLTTGLWNKLYACGVKGRTTGAER